MLRAYVVPPAVTAPGPTTPYTLEELSKHKRWDDCWVAIHGKVYDVSDFMHDHPGGPEPLLDHGGGDATEAFEETPHSHVAYAEMARYQIGVLVDAAPPAAEASAQSTEATMASTSTSEDTTPQAAPVVAPAPAPAPAPEPTPAPASLHRITPEDLASHNTPGDAWICLNGVVYDISTIVGPSAEMLNKVSGTDATAHFAAAGLTPQELGLTTSHMIGELKPPAETA